VSGIRTASIVVAGAAAIGFGALRVTRERLERASAAQIESVVTTAAKDVAPRSGGALDRATVWSAIQSAASSDGVAFCACLDASGAIVGQAEVGGLDEPVDELVRWLGPAVRQARSVTTRGGHAVALVAAPIVARERGGPGRDVGTLLVGRSTATLDAQMTSIGACIWTTIGALMAAAFVVTVPMARMRRQTTEAANEEVQAAAAVARRQSALRRAIGPEHDVLERLQDGLLSNISHEFRTPITSIRAFAEILEQDPTLDKATRKEFAGIIVRESDHLAHLVSDVLDVVRIESGETRFRWSWQAPAALARAAAREIAAIASEKRVVVDVVAPDDLPETIWDGAKVTRLLVELLENAVRFSPDGGRVELAVSVGDERIRFDVRDQGPGIPDEHLETVFEKFRQAGDVLTEKPAGQGLGLPICRLIAQRHEGTVRALSSPRGAHVVAELPLAPRASAAVAVRAKSEVVPAEM
jgi:signal transduction histidine kinase